VTSVSEHDKGDRPPELETSAFRRAAALGAAAAVARLGLQLVFPELPSAVLLPTEVAPLVLGRDGHGDGRLSGTEISRRHAELRAVGGQLVLRDLDSRNGLFVNGRRCGEATLALHDVVRMGEWVGVVVAVPSAEDAGPEPSTFAATLHLGPMARQVAVRAARLARAGSALVLEGETGSGKESFARAIHEWSERGGPFLTVNCAALPEALAEAELFGRMGSDGAFQAARGGTLFLDGISDLPQPAQARLLAVLDARPMPVDVRLLAATQVPLATAVQEKRFRADLQARLAGATLHLPPLRERRADIPSLFLHLLAQHGVAVPELSPRLVEALCVYDWPLNVRELDHLAERLALLRPDEPLLRRAHLPDAIRWFSGEPEGGAAGAPAPDPSRQQLLSELTATGGNLARASQRLGISRQRANRILGDDAPDRIKAVGGQDNG
jgi:hypothetical protein